MASSGSWTVVSVSLSDRVHQYSFLQWAPELGKHRPIQERSGATLVRTFPGSLNLRFS